MNEHAELVATNRLLAAILDHTPMLVAVLNPQFDYLRVNRAYAQADGREPSFFPGKNHFALHPDAENQQIFERVVETGEPYIAHAKPFESAEHPERGASYWDWSLVPITDSRGSVTGLVLMLADATERVPGDLSLCESEEMNRHVLQAIADAVFVTDDAGAFTFVCGNVDHIFGRSAQEVYVLGRAEALLGARVYDPVELENQGEIENIECRIVDKRGIEHTLLVNVKRASIDRGTVLYSCRDITERKQAEEMLGARTRELGERVKELNCLYGISALVEQPGISLEGILQGTAELIPVAWRHPEIACARIVLEDREFRSERFQETEWRLVSDLVVHGRLCGRLEVHYLEDRRQGDEGPFLAEERTLIDAIAERLGRIVERLRAKEQLVWYQRIISTVSDPMSYVDRNYVYRAVNDGYSRYAKRPRQEIVGHTIAELLGEQVFAEHVKPHLDLCFAGREVHYRAWFDVPGEDPKFMDVGYYPVLAADGSVLGAAVNSRDITALRQMEEALQRERDLVTRITETSPVGIVVLDREGRIVYANSQVERVVGLTRDEILGRSFDDPAWRVTDDDGRPLAPERLPFYRLMGSGQTLYDVQHTVILAHQKRLLLSMNAAPLLDESGRFDGAVITVQDVTERAQAEETMRRYTDRLQVLNEQVQRYAGELEQRVAERTAELQESEARFRTLVERAAIGIALVDQDGNLLECNPALGEMLRHSPQELRGKPLAQFVYAREGQSSDSCHELLAGKRDHCQVERRYYRGESQQGWVHLTGSLVRGKDGEPRFAICMIEDITERKRAQAALLQAERLSLAGRLVASLTHEISNPLQSVIGCLGLAEEALAEGEDLEQYLHIALEELRRVARIVAQLRDLNRPSMPEERELTDINKLLQEVLTLSERDCARRGVQVTYDAAENLPSIPVAVDRMRQVFLNLVLNAVDAMPQGGRLEVMTARTRQPDGVRVCFADSGDGIASGILPHIFEPFYSTKPDGLGMGLFISRDLVRGHGGHIAVESEAGAGARFTVWLPEQEGGDEKERVSSKE